MNKLFMSMKKIQHITAWNHSSDIDFKEFMKLSKKSYSFKVNDTALSADNNERIKAINNKIEWNRAQYNLDRQTAKISGIFSKYDSLTIEEESVNLSDMPLLEGDEEVKRRKRLKSLIPNKLLTRVPMNRDYKSASWIHKVLEV